MAKTLNKANAEWIAAISGWPAETRKKLKPDPAPLLAKWGQLQAQFDKKLAELMALDQTMAGHVHGINAIFDDFGKHVPEHDHQSWALFRKLIAEHHRVFCKSVVERLNKAHVHNGAQ